MKKKIFSRIEAAIPRKATLRNGALACLLLLTVLSSPAVARQPDLVFSDSNGAVPDGLLPDTKTWFVEVDLAVLVSWANIGTALADSHKVTLYLSDDMVISNDDTKIFILQADTLDKDAERFTQVRLTVPSVAPGPYYLYAILDIDNEIIELDEDNNTTFYSERITVVEVLALPEEVVVEEVGFGTPYLNIQWTPPVIASAPRIDDVGESDTNSTCEISQGLPGHRFRIRADYADDPEGDVVGGGRPVVPRAQRVRRRGEHSGYRPRWRWGLRYDFFLRMY